MIHPKISATKEDDLSKEFLFMDIRDSRLEIID
jgi:hypothetical protein